jgi:pyruvate kinase
VPSKLTKIAATWGLAVAADEQIARLINAGIDVFRLNFSHANHDEIADAVPRIRALANVAGRPLSLLQDIQGPRIRTGFLPGGEPIALETGAIVEVSGNDPVTSPSAIHVTYPSISPEG